MNRRLLSVVVALLLATGLAGPSTARADEGDNAAIAINTKDGSALFKFAFAIRHVTGELVDETNAAVAFASCTDCRTTAIAIQIVIVEGDPSTFTPTNVSLAINENCTACTTFASAYQFVVQSGGNVRFSQEAWEQIREIRKAIHDLKNETLEPAELDARLDTLMHRLWEVLQTGLVPIGNAEPENDAPPDDQAADQAETTETTTTEQPDPGGTTTAPPEAATTTNAGTITAPAATTTTTAPAETTTAPAATTTTGTTTAPAATTTAPATTTTGTTTGETTTTTP